MCFISERFPFQSIYLVLSSFLDEGGDILLEGWNISTTIRDKISSSFEQPLIRAGFIVSGLSLLNQ